MLGDADAESGSSPGADGGGLELNALDGHLVINHTGVQWLKPPIILFGVNEFETAEETKEMH